MNRTGWIRTTRLAWLFLGLAILAPLATSVGTAVATSLAIIVNGAIAAWMAHRLLGIFSLAVLGRSLVGWLRPGMRVS